ncbi:MAG TPA: hypothetical protein VK808_11945 [Bacteroidia bacterium]|jgi:hypothetical protein|nr:hypothetical protein [Bacteroidia bacterium]
MIHTTVTPVNSKVSLTVPEEYIGKKVEVLLYTLEEAEPNPTASNPKKKPSDYAGSLSAKAADQFLNHIEQSRNEWERDI